MSVLRIRICLIHMVCWSLGQQVFAQGLPLGPNALARQYVYDVFSKRDSGQLPMTYAFDPSYPVLAGVTGVEELEDCRWMYRAHQSPALWAFYNKGQANHKNKYNKCREALLQHSGEDYFVAMNPLLRLSVGGTSQGGLYIDNTRGMALYGVLEGKFLAFTRIVESQRTLMPRERRWYGRYGYLPSVGRAKEYRLFGDTATDYSVVDGYLAYRWSERLRLVVGLGRHHLGMGYRSLWLSGDEVPYSYVQADWSFGRVFYRNLYTSMIARTHADLGGDAALPKKYMAAHVLGYRLGPNTEIAAYEAVVFSRDGMFEWWYLHPLIFYRTVEFQLGSPDNVLLGGQVTHRLGRHTYLYTQFVLDEFLASEFFRPRRGWWGNKWGLQLGLLHSFRWRKLHVRYRVEYNAVRPYTYSHRDSTRSYAHYNAPLAHPWGANFKELLQQLVVRYRDGYVQALWIEGCRGMDSVGTNFGSDILQTHLQGVRPYDNRICQGVRRHVRIVDLRLGWYLWRYLAFELRLQHTTDTSQNPNGYLGSHVVWMCSARYLLPAVRYDY